MTYLLRRGAMLPCVLRPTERNAAHPTSEQTINIPFYEFVGGGHIHGVMDGQPLAEVEVKGIEDATVYQV
jgi:hypothetical protein